MTVLIGWQNDLVASAALMIDGVVVAAVEEERFTRVKQQEGFPAASVEWLLEHAGLQIEDVDAWPYGWHEGSNTDELLPRLVRRVLESAADPVAVEVMLERLRSENESDRIISARGMEEARAFGVPLDRVFKVEHHRAHAWSAFAPSPFDEALVITADGRGDRKSITVQHGNSSGLRELEWSSSIDSLGHLYSQVTHVLGYSPNRHEGKVTGLAAHGDRSVARPFLETLCFWRDGEIRCNAGLDFIPSDSNIPPQTLERMRSFTPADLAAGVQGLVEDLICQLVAKWVERTGMPRVVLAGGLFANVAINRRIREMAVVEDVYVQPNMGDAGLPLGACAELHWRETGKSHVSATTQYLGPDANPAAIREPDITFGGLTQTVDWLAQRLAEGAVCGVVHGRLEFGPRALCNRSILAQASDHSLLDDLNGRLRRTEFMPFAPVLRDIDANRSFTDWTPNTSASTMTMAYPVSQEFARTHPAVTHVDGTARPQVLTQVDNAFIYELLERYSQLSGRWALVNTSFNVHEEPIILSARDGLRALDAGIIDVLVTERGAYVFDVLSETDASVFPMR